MTADPEGRWILLVDDDSRVRSAGKRLFESLGHHCLTAGNHGEAVDALTANPRIVAAIVDYQMPDGDARDLVRELRRLRPDLLIIGSSGSVEAEAAFAEYGVTSFLSKPWDLDQIPALLSPAG